MYLFLVKFLFRVLFCSRIAKRNDTKRKNIIGQVSIFTHYLHTVVCVIFAAWFGLKYWNKDDEKDETR